MKTKLEIEERIKILEDMLVNPEFADEIIMGFKQRSKIRTKIEVLNWVLDKKEKPEEKENGKK
jgi:hypothetical protein